LFHLSFSLSGKPNKHINICPEKKKKIIIIIMQCISADLEKNSSAATWNSSSQGAVHANNGNHHCNSDKHNSVTESTNNIRRNHSSSINSSCGSTMGLCHSSQSLPGQQTGRSKEDLIENDDDHGYDSRPNSNSSNATPIPALKPSSSCSLTTSPTVSSNSEQHQQQRHRRRHHHHHHHHNCSQQESHQPLVKKIQQSCNFFRRMKHPRRQRPTSTASNNNGLPTEVILTTDGRPPLFKTRLRIQEDGGIETYYYNTHELDYSDDEEDLDQEAGGGSCWLSRSQPLQQQHDLIGSAITIGGYFSEGAGGAQEVSVESDIKFNDDVEEWDDDSWAGLSMYFVNNESVLLEVAPEDLATANPKVATKAMSSRSLSKSCRSVQ
jgi:hypothetical protein